jgi:hypothetical protein
MLESASIPCTTWELLQIFPLLIFDSTDVQLHGPRVFWNFIMYVLCLVLKKIILPSNKINVQFWKKGGQVSMYLNVCFSFLTLFSCNVWLEIMRISCERSGSDSACCAYYMIHAIWLESSVLYGKKGKICEERKEHMRRGELRKEDVCCSGKTSLDSSLAAWTWWLVN